MLKEKRIEKLYQYIIRTGETVWNIGANSLEDANFLMSKIIKETYIPKILETGNDMIVDVKLLSIQELEKFSRDIGVQTFQFVTSEVNESTPQEEPRKEETESDKNNELQMVEWAKKILEDYELKNKNNTK